MKELLGHKLIKEKISNDELMIVWETKLIGLLLNQYQDLIEILLITLNYVRKLKENNVAVFFEDDNINTLSMDGELLLIVFSSVAQWEVENILSNVKKGLKMKMQRGEFVGFQSCLGYDYDLITKQISVNQEEK